MSDSLTKKTLNATKWSSITEVISKLTSPILNMILARILAPEAFGVLATVTMIISFAEIFVESGFQKFLIQHEFSDEREEHQYMSVAFWANLVLSALIWLGIIIFQDPIASLAGNGELGYVIAISGVMIPMYGIIGIQNCIIKKRLEFKKLFYVRLPSAIVPIAVTIPLACLGFGFWSLIIGNILGVAARSIILIFVGKFKPLWHFSFKKLGFMFRFGIFTLLDGLAIWATNWVDMFLIGTIMSDFELGLYKNSLSIVTALFSMVHAALTPVLYSSLSRLQNDEKEFGKMFSNTQKALCMILLPMGVGMFLYRQLATEIMLGSQWSAATGIIGLTAITFSLRAIFVSMYSVAFQAKGKFYIPLIMQLADLVILIPTCLISANAGFDALVTARALIRLDLIIPEMIVIYFVCHISPIDTAKNLYPYFISTGIMCAVAVLLKMVSSSMLWSFISIFICVIAYFASLCIFRFERTLIFNQAKRILTKIKK